MAKRLPLGPEAYPPWMTELAARKTRKKVPAWLPISDLPELHDGSGIVPEPVVEALLKLLAENKSADPLVDALKAWCAPKVCGTFAKKLLSTWRARKFSKPDDWTYTAAVALADDSTAKPLLALAKAFQNTARHDRVPGIVADVANLGTDDALRELITFSRDTDGFIGHIDTALRPVAKQRGVSLPALVEGLLPAREFLLSLTSPKAMPTLIKKHDVPALLDRDGVSLDKTMQLAVVRALVTGGGTWRSVKYAVDAMVDPASGAAFALGLLNAWAAEDFHGRYDWVGNALGAMGDDQVAFTLKPHLRKLSHRNASDTDRQKAMSLMRVFGQIGTDSALLVLIGLGQANTRPSVFDAAWGVIRQAAGSRHISPEQLEDRVTPDCGLDDTGGRTFDFGPRSFRLVFDDDFRPRLADPEGGFIDALPSPTSADAPDKVAASQAAWALMARQLDEILDIQTERLRRAMAQGRMWTASDWRTWILNHPLMGNYAQRLVWAIHAPDGTVLHVVRAAEDRTLSDIDDETVPLADDQRVSLVHPAQLTIEDRGAWADHLADYEILQAFPQLAQPVHVPADPAATAVLDWRNAGVHARQLYESFLGRGWDRDGGYGQRTAFTKRYAGKGVDAEVKMDPGYSAGGVDYAGLQSLPMVCFWPSNKTHDDANRLPLGQVDPVVYTEVIEDVLAAVGGEDDEHARRVR